MGASFMTLGPRQSDNGWGFSLCGSQVACFPWGDYADGGTHGWFVVSRGYSTTLLAIVLSAGYALVVRELRQINANLEQAIELGAVARRHDDRCADHHTKILDGIHRALIGPGERQIDSG